MGSVMMQRENGVLWGGTAARYKPFGGYAGGTPANYIQNRGFTGHDRTQADDALGVVYMNARVYMPSTGKFLTADTLVPDPKDSQSYNRYAYVHNNPIQLIDSSGHSPLPSECRRQPYLPICAMHSNWEIQSSTGIDQNLYNQTVLDLVTQAIANGNLTTVAPGDALFIAHGLCETI